MAKKIIKEESKKHTSSEKEAIIIDQPITETLEINYMPYAMSVIVSRALPEIDGFKPAHRKLLYTMYKMGLLNGNKTKSANIVGQTMKLNPHGDSSIYETMVRLTVGNEALLCPYVDSKGNFGKHYSRDMAYAASRYTEAKLCDISKELFNDLDKNAIDMIDNYDGTLKEPRLFPVTFPSILVNSNMGIAVGMASNICSFNLKEVCDATILRIKDPKSDVLSIIKGADFATGGEILFNKEELEKIRDTGRGNIVIRAKYKVDRKAGIIEIFEIPYSTTIENIIDDIVALVKNNKIKEINAIRDETDLKGLKIAIDYKKSFDPDLLMKKLYKMTKLQDTFACNFNVLIDGYPKVMGITQILDEWIKWRTECVTRSLTFDLEKKKHALMLLQGLEKISLNINKAIKIIRETEKDSEVEPNLMKAFKINEEQAAYVAEIKLRNLNKDYILNRLKDIEKLQKEIDNISSILNSKTKKNNLIIKTLEEISKKYGQPRKTSIITDAIEEYEEPKEEIPDYNIKIYRSNDGYLKKIPEGTKTSDFTLKSEDFLVNEINTTNNTELIFFTNKQNIYKYKTNSLKDMKYSDLGEYLPNLLGLESDEIICGMSCLKTYKEKVLICFENGKIAKIPAESYQTKTNRKKLINSISDASPIVSVVTLEKEDDIYIESSANKCAILNSKLISEKTTKNTAGVVVFKLKNDEKIQKFVKSDETINTKYRVTKSPTSGKTIS